MAATAAVISIALALALATSGAWKLASSEYAEHTAMRLEAEPTPWRIYGGAEVVAALALLMGLSASRSSAWGVLNEAGAVVAIALCAVSFFRLRRAGDQWRSLWPWVALVGGALVELVFRLAQ